MKRLFFLYTIILLFGAMGCKKEKFAEYYVAPNTIQSSTIEKQFSGTISSSLDYTMYRYGNYFVVLQNTLLHYTQAVGFQNAPKQYEPGAAAIGDRWNWYFSTVAQYKEFLKVYNSAPAEEQAEKRIYLVAATIFYYDQTQKMVDMHGDLPFTNAGLLSTNDGDYQSSYASYEDAESIYTKMLDDLMSFADELSSLQPADGVSGVFRTQDFINNGDLKKWKQYCNALRIRMLMRVSEVGSMQTRVSSEIASILSNPTNYPIPETNSDNIMIDVYSLDNSSVTSDLYNGIIGWGNGDIGSKVMIDHMNNSDDPRLRAMFQPGESAGTDYNGLDVSLDATTQGDILNDGLIARYNFSTISKNKKLPGILITAAETQLNLADYYLNVAGDAAAAKAAYEKGVKNSIEFYHWLRTISDNSETAVAPLAASEITAYLADPEISWAAATSDAEKYELIQIQKWINYSILQPIESWSEIRKSGIPSLSFVPDNASQISTIPPVRLFYPDDERINNTDNYNAVKEEDKLTTKLFWDVN